jgi:hypothetical protein
MQNNTNKVIPCQALAFYQLANAIFLPNNLSKYITEWSGNAASEKKISADPSHPCGPRSIP